LRRDPPIPSADDKLVHGLPPDPLVELYDHAYYTQNLHRLHWFHNNTAKQELRWNEILRMVAPRADDTLLDLGCAVGEYTFRLAPLVGRVIGVDFSPDAIAIASQRAAALDVQVEFLQTSVTDLSAIPSASITKALAADLVEHITDETLDAMLQEVWRVLRPGGTLSIYTPCASHYVEQLKARNFVLKQLPGHIAVRTAEECDRHLRLLPWKFRRRYFSPSTYPLVGIADRVLSRVPGIGRFFRYRYCAVVERT
jgi:SAM-dependent methyltransferase